ncbi:hypothetical protein LAZ67_10003417 [Cordylochernes scorpioides]|uniref:CCHC-type domain-containing protein n=1 Tax=Cordylochernes scorpioides TaxID=51811 RepID=A0ABY6KX70_9ARAC|nr:hypothetical protein LAZ67_10003417 [Cordylochernes scorpioides]
MIFMVGRRRRLLLLMVETRSGKMQDPAQERIQAEESAKPQPGVTIGRDASFDPVVLNPNIDIPKYDGSEDPRPWIESLEEIGFLYHWADYIISRYAAMNMTGSAKTWLNLHKASFTSWENIKIRLIQDFSLDANKEELRMKLNRMQHWNEPAIRFAEDILVLCNKVDPAMEEETKIEHVIGGLKKEYSFALYLNPPKTTDDLLVVCKKMDSFEKKYRERVEKSRNLYNGPRYSRPQQQSRQYRNNFPQPSTPRRPYNPNFVPKPNLQRNTYNKSQEVSKNRTEDGRPICFKCNKPGHVARYCRVKFIRILEEDPADTQEKVEEKCQMNEISEKSGPRLYADALVETEDGEYIIEESSKMFQTNGLRLARSLINVINRETHIWITNPYPRPLKIMKNQTLAFGSSPAKINEQKELKQVLERYGDLFSSRLGRTNLAKHRIDTEDAKPIKHKPYRDYFIGKRNVIYERAKFNRRSQGEMEPVEEFITNLYVLAETCSYGILKEEMIRDRLVVGVKNFNLSEKLQLESELTLEKAIQIVRQSESVKNQQKEIRQDTEDRNVDVIEVGKANPHTSDVTESSTSPGRTVRPPRRFGED